jgi:hypothetical protein
MASARTPTAPVIIQIANLRGNGGSPLQITAQAAVQIETEPSSAGVVLLPSPRVRN